MKALEILKNNENARKFVEPNHLNNAIKELEEMQNRSCSSCKFVGYFSPHESLECQNNDCNFYSNDVDIFTSCNKWEVKNEK